MARKGESVTLSLTTAEKEALEQIALRFGCRWGQKPNVSGLLKAIAAGDLRIYDDDLPKPEVKRSRAKTAIERIKQGLDDLSSAL